MTSVRHLHEIRIQHEVPFHDADPLGVAWHGHYYKYFELARTQLLRDLKLDGQNLLELNYRFLVSESGCRHIHALSYAEVFEVAAWIEEYTHRLFIAYEIRSLKHERRCATGFTRLITTNTAGELLLRTPQTIQDRIAPDSP
ncbi:acyl-CoA thioesterase [Myxococcota bacterium]|nr:acyl-CoA thioesterase [Myxococcota bacterium]